MFWGYDPYVHFTPSCTHTKSCLEFIRSTVLPRQRGVLLKKDIALTKYVPGTVFPIFTAYAPSAPHSLVL